MLGQESGIKRVGRRPEKNLWIKGSKSRWVANAFQGIMGHTATPLVGGRSGIANQYPGCKHNQPPDDNFKGRSEKLGIHIT